MTGTPDRVVTLLPAATEIVCALGVEPVGVSHECDYPPSVADVPEVTALQIDPHATSGEIDAQVTAAASEDGDGVYDLDRDLLADLNPDLIVTQAVCDVCAVERPGVIEAVVDLGIDAGVESVDVHSLDDLYESIRRLGDALGRSDRADALIDRLRDRVDAVRETAAANGGRGASEGPRVAVLDWLDPVMVAGHWVPELVAAAGGRYGLAETGARSRPREWSELREYDPEVLVLSPCGFDLAQTRENLADVTERSGWGDLAAVRAGRVFLMDGSQYVNRGGPRLVDTLERLAPLIRPDRFPEPPADGVESGDGVRRLAAPDE